MTKSLGEKEAQELRLLFTSCTEALEFSKKQQWHTLYITLVALGGLLTVAERYDLCPREYHFVWWCWTICVIGLIFMFTYLYSIMKSRGQKLKISEKFSDEARSISGISSKNEMLANFRDLFFTLVFSVIIVTGTYLVSEALKTLQK
jgi:hypothetical protein